MDVILPPVKKFNYYYTDEATNTIEPSRSKYIFIHSKVIKYLNDEMTRKYLGSENRKLIYKFMKFIIESYSNTEFILQVGS